MAVDLDHAMPAHAVRVTSHICDVADEADVVAFRDQLQIRHETDYLDLVFNNAGIAGNQGGANASPY